MGEIVEQIDVPESFSQNTTDKKLDNNIDKKDSDIAKMKEEHESKKTDCAFIIAKICLLLVGVVLINDLFCLHKNKDYDSQMLNNIFEIIKTILLISVGYLFGNKNS